MKPIKINFEEKTDLRRFGFINLSILRRAYMIIKVMLQSGMRISMKYTDNSIFIGFSVPRRSEVDYSEVIQAIDQLKSEISKAKK